MSNFVLQRDLDLLNLQYNLEKPFAIRWLHKYNNKIELVMKELDLREKAWKRLEKMAEERGIVLGSVKTEFDIETCSGRVIQYYKEKAEKQEKAGKEKQEKAGKEKQEKAGKEKQEKEEKEENAENAENAEKKNKEKKDTEIVFLDSKYKKDAQTKGPGANGFELLTRWPYDDFYKTSKICHVLCGKTIVRDRKIWTIRAAETVYTTHHYGTEMKVLLRGQNEKKEEEKEIEIVEHWFPFLKKGCGKSENWKIFDKHNSILFDHTQILQFLNDYNRLLVEGCAS